MEMALGVREMRIGIGGVSVLRETEMFRYLEKPRCTLARLDRSALPGGHAVMGKCLFDMIVAGNDGLDNGDMQAWVGEA